MTDRPIIFSAPMVRALLDGRKTQTRRVLKPQPFPVGGAFYRPFPNTDPRQWYSLSAAGIVVNIQTVPYAPGDRLWMREAFATDGLVVRYYATDDVHELRKKLSPIHMPRWASRLTLTVTEVKVQRLQEITEGDAAAEGIDPRKIGWIPERAEPPEIWWFGSDVGRRTARDAFSDLWASIHGPDAWDANPWVAAITFDVHKCNIDHMGDDHVQTE